MRTLGGPRLIVLASFALVTLAGGSLALSRSPVFAVRSIEVTGADRLAPDRLRALAEVDPGADLLWLDVANVEARIEQEAWVADATIARALPSTLEISIVERTPVAVVRTSAADMLVSADGTLLGRAPPGMRLPRLVVPAAALGGETASSAVWSLSRVVRWLPRSIRSSVETVGLQDDGSVLLTMGAGGPVVEFGVVDDLRAKGRALRHVLSWVRRHAVSVDAISLVSPGAPAVSPSG